MSAFAAEKSGDSLVLLFLSFSNSPQVSWGPALYRLAKALWFKHLDPDVLQAPVKGVEEEEEYDEYDENLYEDYDDNEREGGLVDGDVRRRETAAFEEEEYLEESVVPGPNQAGGYVFKTNAGQVEGDGEYVYEADEEGDDWEGDEEEGDYEDYEEVHAEYEGVHQGEYFDEVNQGGYLQGANQAEYYAGANQAAYYAGANHFDDTSTLYEDVY